MSKQSQHVRALGREAACGHGRSYDHAGMFSERGRQLTSAGYRIIIERSGLTDAEQDELRAKLKAAVDPWWPHNDVLAEKLNGPTEPCRLRRMDDHRHVMKSLGCPKVWDKTGESFEWGHCLPLPLP